MGALGLALKPWLPAVMGKPELLRNKLFATDTAGWTAQNGAEISIVSGEMVITADGDNSPRFSQAVATKIGQKYVFRGTHRRGTTPASTALLVSNNAQLFSAFAASASNATTDPVMSEVPFTATATTTYVGGGIVSASATGTAIFDNFSVTRT